MAIGGDDDPDDPDGGDGDDDGRVTVTNDFFFSPYE